MTFFIKIYIKKTKYIYIAANYSGLKLMVPNCSKNYIRRYY